MQVVLYGIPNCDAVKRARGWLAERGIEVRFHDFKKAGVLADALARWMASAGWERLLNRQGTTWRRLEEGVRVGVSDAASAAALMAREPSVVKRPVIEWPGGALTVGFDPEHWPVGAGSRHS
ncbi:MAG: Spx/MgsR family RNA polymerase-binding regulatory protein [Rubrivivax sp.]|nr:Spx/MgsR family RNA polymerase-binding regulatory protein [Rubrivivax sp.]